VDSVGVACERTPQQLCCASQATILNVCVRPCVFVVQVGGDSMVSDKNSAIVTINATGIIQMANKVLTQMLG
jgi:hypothetical protein